MNTLRKFHIAGYVLVYNDCEDCQSGEPVVFETAEFERLSHEDLVQTMEMEHLDCWEREFASDCA